LTAIMAFALRLPALIRRVQRERTSGQPGPGHAA